MAVVQATLCAVVLFTAYVLQQRFAPFLSLRAFNEAVKSVAEQGKPAPSKRVAGAAHALWAGSHGPRPGVQPRRRQPQRRKSSWFEPDAADIARLRNGHVLDRLRLSNASVLVGVVMQRVMEDYNHLESTYLVSGMLVLLAGLVFNGRGFPAGSVPYHFLTAAVAFIVISATVTFVVLIAVELYKSFRDADLHAALRAAEAASIETSLRSGVRSRNCDGGAVDSPGLVGGTACGDLAVSTGDDDGNTCAAFSAVETRPGEFAVENPLRHQTRGRGGAGAAAHADARGGTAVPRLALPPGVTLGRGATSAMPPLPRGSPGTPSRLRRVRAAQRPVLSARVGGDGPGARPEATSAHP